MIAERIGPRNYAIILFAVAAALLFAASSLTWSSIQRWRAVSAVKEWQTAQLEKDEDTAKASAELAATLMEGDAACVLPSLKLTDPGTPARLARLAREVKAPQRDIVRLASAFSATLQGKPGETGGGDGIALKCLSALNAAQPNDSALVLSLPEHATVHATILRRCLERQVQEAWRAGKKDAVTRSAGALALCDPRHPDQPKLRLITAASDPAYGLDRMRQVLTGTGEDGNGFVRTLAALFPERAGDLLLIIPASARNDDERLRLLIEEKMPLDRVVETIVQTPNDTVISILAKRCLDSGRLDLAAKLVDKATGDIQRQLRIVIASREGDLATLAALVPERGDLFPRVSVPVARPGMVAFHLATPSGLVPRATTLKLLLDAQDVESTRIVRYGSLIGIDLSNLHLSGQCVLEVRLGDRSVASFQVDL